MDNHSWDFDDFIDKFFKGKPIPNGVETRLEELGMDSLELLEFIMRVEEQSGVDLSMEDLNEQMTLSQAKDSIRKLIEKRSP